MLQFCTMQCITIQLYQLYITSHTMSRMLFFSKSKKRSTLALKSLYLNNLDLNIKLKHLSLRHNYLDTSSLKI